MLGDGPASSISFQPMVEESEASTRKRKPRKAKDPNRPLGYVSAFNKFVQEFRPVFLARYPSASKSSNNDINKVMGKAWKLLPNSQVVAYEAKSDKDKKR